MGVAVRGEIVSSPLTRRVGENKEIEKLSWGWKEISSKILFALCSAAVLACSCHGKAAPLNERIQAYWDARVKRQVERAFEFETPGVMEKQDYLTNMMATNIAFTKYSIRSIREKADEAEVDLQVEYLLPGLSRPVSSSMLDKWVRVEGRWYHLLMRAGEDGATSEEGR